MCTFICSSLELDKVKVKGADQKAGVDIVKKALEAPIRQITANAGVDGSVVVGKLLEGKKPSQGYDAQEEEYCDMFAKGIIDPTKVVRTALQDAASIAGILVTTEAMVADKPEEKRFWSCYASWWYGRNGWYGRHGNVIIQNSKQNSKRAVSKHLGFFFISNLDEQL